MFTFLLVVQAIVAALLGPLLSCSYSRGIARPPQKDWIGIARIASAHHSTGQPSAYTAAHGAATRSVSQLSHTPRRHRRAGTISNGRN